MTRPRPHDAEVNDVYGRLQAAHERIAALEARGLALARAVAEVERLKAEAARHEHNVGELLKRAQADERRMAWAGQDEDPWELWFDVGEPGGKDAGPRDRDRAQAWRQIVDARMGEKENEE